MKPKVAIIGQGNAGKALRQGLEAKGYEVKAVGRDPNRVKEIAQWGDMIFLAVPFAERENALRSTGGAYKGKTLVDITNAVGRDEKFAVDPTEESGAEQLKKIADGAKIVKAFNTVFAKNMAKGEVKGEKQTLFVAGDDNDSKTRVRDLGRDLGYDCVDSGPLHNARWMETLGYFNMQLANGQRMGPDIGFKLIH